MIKLVVGAIIGAAIAIGGAFWYQHWLISQDPCEYKCGTGTHCRGEVCIPIPPPQVDLPGRAKRAPPPKRKDDGAASDGKMAVEGDDIDRPTTRVDLTESGTGKPDLTHAELDAVFAKRRDDIAECVAAAATGAKLPSAKVMVSFRVDPRGEVRGVRVEAPQVMLKNNLYGCVRPMVQSLKFPRTDGSTVATYPFDVK